MGEEETEKRGEGTPAANSPHPLPPIAGGSATAMFDNGEGTSSNPGASATYFNPSHRNYNPRLASLFDSFRDIADTNSWDKLDPSQIQGLMESFKSGERDRFGLDLDSYTGVANSFNQFLGQLHNRFITSGSDTTPNLSDYLQSHEPAAYQTHHLKSQHPSKCYTPPSSTSAFPTPHRGGVHQSISTQAVGGAMTHFTPSYAYTSSSHEPGTMGPPSTWPEHLKINSAATDLIDDDDDFDWSKLM